MFFGHNSNAINLSIILIENVSLQLDRIEDSLLEFCNDCVLILDEEILDITDELAEPVHWLKTRLKVLNSPVNFLQKLVLLCIFTCWIERVCDVMIEECQVW
jgi:hypothetical protein